VLLTLGITQETESSQGVDGGAVPGRWCGLEQPGVMIRFTGLKISWLVVEPTPLENIRQNGNLPQVWMKIQKKIETTNQYLT